MRKFTLKLVAFYLTIFFAFTSLSYPSTDAHRLLSLIDYIGGDYKNAVNKGEIINHEEFEEMVEFSEEALKLYNNLKTDHPDNILIGENLLKLKEKIQLKESISNIDQISKDLKKEVITFYEIKPYPSQKPDLTNGKTLFTSNCSTCHGTVGKGDGVLAPNLVPAPTNFTTKEVLLSLSPFKVFNTTSFGIEGTAMPPFSIFSDEEQWDVAFYVLSLGFPDDSNTSGPNNKPKIPDSLKDYKKLATLSNQEILDQLNSENEQKYSSLKFIRTNLVEKQLHEESPIEITLGGINSALELYKKGEFKGAFNKSLDAYLNGFEQIEADLFVKDRNFTTDIENKLSLFRAGIQSQSATSDLEKLSKDITKDLNKASLILADKNSFDSAVLFTNSFSIIVREALEAILIIAAIIAFLSNTGAGRTIKYIHFGWVSAIFAGLVTWFLAKTVISISAARREVIEGVTSLAAAAVLFYVSYWLISKIEVEKWKEYIKSKVENAINKKSVIALVAVAFLAVYREAFETVLFYQALLYQAESTTSPVVWGLLAGIVFITLIAFVIFKLAVRIPLKYFFSITSLFLYFLCFILVGKGIHEFQEAGIIETTFINNVPTIDTLGIYPSLETLIPQTVIFSAFIFAILWIGYISKEKERERKEIAVTVSQIAEEMATMHDSFDHIKGHILEWKRCEDIDLEAEDLDKQIHDVIDHVNQLQTKLGDFFQAVSQPSATPKNLN